MKKEDKRFTVGEDENETCRLEELLKANSKEEIGEEFAFEEKDVQNVKSLSVGEVYQGSPHHEPIKRVK